MKELTISRLSISSLKHRRKTYRLLLMGIVLSIYFVCTLALSVMGVMEGSEIRFRQRVGFQDLAISDAEPLTADLLLEKGLASRAGTITLLGQHRDQPVAVGALDDMALTILDRRCTEGRLPQAPGEIAAERSALGMLRIDANVGDTITLSLTDMSRMQPTADSTFTLVGILTEQSNAMVYESFSAARFMSGFPQMIVAAPQALVPLGMVSRTLVANLAPGVNKVRFEGALRQSGYHQDVLFFSGGLFGDASRELLTILLLLGLSLILTGCIGIANAFQTQMSDRREQIGMMRTAGATRRQIRRIFVREALLIALATAPAALLLALGTVALAARFSGGMILMPRQWWVYLAALALSIGVVFAAALIPAFRGARVSPMQVLRNTQLTRRLRKKSLRSRRQFWVPRMMALRNAQLYPARQIGLALVIALVMFLAMGVAPAWHTMLSPRALQDGEIGYTLYGSSYTSYTDLYQIIRRGTGLQEADMQEMAHLAHVKSVEWTENESVKLLLPRTGLYMQLLADSFMPRPMDGTVPQLKKQDSIRPEDSAQAKYAGLDDLLGTDTPLLPVHVDIIALDQEVLERLAVLLSDGRVDLQRVNRGEDVLMYLPRQYVSINPDYNVFETSSVKPDRQRTVLYELDNDQFRPGDMLNLLQAYVFEDEAGPNLDMSKPYHRFAAPAVGGILADPEQRIWALASGGWFNPGALLTSHEGLRALGLYTKGLANANVYVDTPPEGEAETALTRTIEQIALRDPNVGVDNRLENMRESRVSTARGVAALTGVILLFTALSIALVNSGLSSRVRSDKRTLGMLRALGADTGALRQMYRLQLVRMLVPGVLLGALASAAIVINSRGLYTMRMMPLVIGLEAGLLLAVVLASALHVRTLIRRTADSSIVENIREL